jgi:hypothetical protein
MKTLIAKRLQALHPQCLIRDIQLEDNGNNGLVVRYIKVKKDDSWSRVSLTMVIDNGE